MTPTVALEGETILAEAASRAIEQDAARGETLRVQITDADGDVTALDVPPSAVHLIRAMLKEMGDGKALTLVADEAEITIRQAADLLLVSRPYLVGMIDKGELPARMVGKQRRLPLKAVLAFKKDNEAKRREVLGELVALDQKLGFL